MRAIVTYHSLDGSGSPISVAPEVFEEHLRWFGSGAVEVVALGHLLEADPSRPTVAITFDDGFANVAGPVARLAERGLPVTVFVVTGHVGGTNDWNGRSDSGVPTLPLLGWHELGLLAERGVALGAHTRTHPRLSALSREQVLDELDEPLETMGRELGQRPTAFAYPYGVMSEMAKQEAGDRYRWSCSTEFRMVGEREDSRALPRLDMYYWREPGAIGQVGRPGFGARVWVRRQARRVRALMIP